MKVDPAARPEPAIARASVDELLAALGREAGAAADRIESVPAGSWSRTATIDDGSGRTITALDIARADHPVAGLAGGRGVDAGAVLELGERLLAIAGHDRRPPRGTQRYGLLRMAAVGNFLPETCARQREHARHTFYHKAKRLRRDPHTVSLPR